MAKNKNTNHFNIIDWFRKIVKQQKKTVFYTLLSILVAIASLVVTFKMYVNSLPSQITVLYSNHHRGALKKVNNIAVFHSFIMPSENGQVMLGWEDEGGSYGMPMLANRTGKAISNMDLKVWVHFPALSINKGDICPDYEIVRYDPKNNQMELKYTPNILRAWDAIPVPIRTLYQAEPDIDEAYVNRTLNIVYSMTYEGAKKPINIKVLYDVNKDNVLSEKALRSFFTDVYYEVYENDRSSYKSNQWMISVIHGYDYDVFDWPRHGNRDMYDRAKDKYINKILDRYSITPNK